MGIHNLWRLLDNFAHVTQPEAWRGKRVAVDASIWMAQFRAQSGTNGDDTDRRILEGFLLRILKLLFYQITPVIVFDGMAPAAKLEEQRRRAAQRTQTEQQLVVSKARRILSAQVAAGLDVSALPRSAAAVHKARSSSPKKSKSPSQKHHRTVRRSRGSTRRKQKRVVVVAPESVSRDQLSVFLDEQVDVQRGYSTQLLRSTSNLLGSSTSGSMFLGPRTSVDEDLMVLVPVATGTDLVDEGNARATSVSSSTASSSSSSCGSDVESVHSLHSVMRSRSDVGGASAAADAKSTACRNSTSDASSFGHLGDAPDTKSPRFPRSSTSVFASDGGDVDADDDDDDESVVASDVEFVGQFVPRECSSGSTDSSIVIVGTSPAPPSNVAAPAVVEGPQRAAAAVPASLQFPARDRHVPFEILEIVELLSCCGVPWIVSPAEADAQCAFLSKHRIVDAVFTEDSDVFVHGARVVLRGFFSSSRTVTAYSADDMERVGLDGPALLGLALLLGSDYAAGVRGIGSASAVDALSTVFDGSTAREDVGGLLSRWRANVITRDVQYLDGCSLLQRTVALRHTREKGGDWKPGAIPGDFPKQAALDAFLVPAVDDDLTAVAAGDVDFARLRTFAATRGLHGCAGKIDITKKEIEARNATRQRLMTEFLQPVAPAVSLGRVKVVSESSRVALGHLVRARAAVASE